MAFTRVQTKGSNSSGTSLTATFDSALTSGSLLVCWAVARGTITCSDPTNGSWTALTNETGLFAGSSKNGRWFYVINQAATSAVTVTVSNTTTGTNWMQVAEYSSTGVTYDSAVYTRVEDISATTISVNANAPTQDGLWLWGIGANTEGASTYTVSSGMDNVVGTANQAGGAQTMAMGEKLLTSGANSATFNCGTSTDRGGIAIGFYDQPSGGTPLEYVIRPRPFCVSC